MRRRAESLRPVLSGSALGGSPFGDAPAKGRLRNLAFAFAAVALAVAGVALFRTARLSSTTPAEPRVERAVDAAAVAEHLAGAIRFETVAVRGGAGDRAAFRGLLEYLRNTYPLVHERLRCEEVGENALLCEWRGADESRAPVVLMAHLDVVPVLPRSEPRWTHPPWSGAIDGGFVYGRGALDDKSAVVGILEAAEQLLRAGHRPARTIYLAFGADEELGGARGAMEIVRSLRSRGVAEPALVLDEGGALVERMLPGVEGPAAVVGIAEKGYLSLELSVRGPGGHSSTPVVPTQIGRLSRALARLEAKQFPARLDGATLEMLRAVAPVAPYGNRIALANLWLFGPLVTRRLLADPRTATLVRTTTAPTMFDSGATENVLPEEARAVVNFQVLPGGSIQQVVERARSVIADPEVTVRLVSGGLESEPSPVSDVSSPAFAAIAKSIRQTARGRAPVVVPFLTGPTDARHWSTGGSRNVFRFTPFPYEQDWMSRVHGTDERISVEGLADGVRFYVQLILNAERI